VTTFGLVHGAHHGSWCWERLVPELAARGHETRTVDLPNENPTAGAASYAEACLDAFAGVGGDLVVVGHSLGGLTVPLVARERPVRLLVFLCALYPRPGRAHNEVMRAEPDMLERVPPGATFEEDGVQRWHREAAARFFFSDCTPADAAWAAGRLSGQCWTVMTERTPLDSWPDTPCAAIIGQSDPVAHTAWSRRVTPEILGRNPVELPGGHAPFLARPAALADALAALVG
jgi:pimeloyl-ACP methyl ester carboxylesterase